MRKFVALAFLLCALLLQGQNHEKACATFSKINYLLQKRHFKPKPVDDSLSVYVFNTVIGQLDDNKTLLLQEDYDRLQEHSHKIDDYVLNNNCRFFSDFIEVYKNALQRSRDYVVQISNEPLLYTTNDTIYFSKSSYPYLNDTSRIKKYLRKKITYDVLDDVAKLGKNKDSLANHIDSLGLAAKKKVIDTYLCRIDNQLNPTEGFNESMYNLFFATFCSYFDPHSTYFTYNEKASFVSSISSENYSLGMYVSQNEKEEIIVEELVPGGPAYRARKIDKGDQLLKLTANKNEYEVSCASLQTITEIVYSDSYKKVTLTLRKKDGTVYSVALQKTIMKADDHSVYSFVIGDSNPVGYIKIPSFYTAFDTNSGHGVADDVAAEVTKLKKDNITGLIIDLQHNGGGSMDEVIRMSGMFVNFGPLAIVTDKNRSYNVIKDYNRGMLYDGPMVVLTNGFSASASEFFAGVMQDYNRALIVGSPTLGKATMQTIIPLDENSKKPDQFLKITLDKFYRVTGKSSQYTGILPDIALPAFFEELLPLEKSMPTALKNDSITIAVPFTKMAEKGKKEVINRSKSRTEKDEDFILVKNVNLRISKVYQENKSPLPVTFSNVFDDTHNMDDIWKDITDATEKEQDLLVKNSVNNSKKPNDEYGTMFNNFRIKAIKTDIYIKEAINILNDIKSETNH